MDTPGAKIRAAFKSIGDGQVCLMSNNPTALENIADYVKRATEKELTVGVPFAVMERHTASEFTAIAVDTYFSNMKQDEQDFLDWLEKAGDQAPIIVPFGASMELTEPFKEHIGSDEKWAELVTYWGEDRELAAIFEKIASKLEEVQSAQTE